MTAQCATCGKALGTTAQKELFSTQEYRIDCLTKGRISMVLLVLPEEEEERAWNRLSAFEQSFLPSVREQFIQKETLSEKQYQVLEQIYDRHK